VAKKFGPSIWHRRLIFIRSTPALLETILAEANQAVGGLDGITSAFPNLNSFHYS
jgi:hypothetical protein